MHVAGRSVRAFALALATIVLVSCESPPPPPPASMPVTGCHVGLLGDSLSVRVESRLPAALERRTCTRVWVDASVGRTTAQGVDALKRRRDAGQLPAVLVVGLGTNDRYQMSSFAAHVDSIMGISAGRPVVWIEVAYAPIKDELNAVLRRKAAQWSNLTIMAWDQAYWQHPEWRSSDSVHLTDVGADQRAQHIAAAAQRVAK